MSPKDDKIGELNGSSGLIKLELWKTSPFNIPQKAKKRTEESKGNDCKIS